MHHWPKWIARAVAAMRADRRRAGGDGATIVVELAGGHGDGRMVRVPAGDDACDYAIFREFVPGQAAGSTTIRYRRTDRISAGGAVVFEVDPGN